MLRWTFHILTLMSLVLMIASCVAWSRVGMYEGITHTSSNRMTGLGYDFGHYEFFDLEISRDIGLSLTTWDLVSQSSSEPDW